MKRFLFYLILSLFTIFPAFAEDSDIDTGWLKLLHYQKSKNKYVSLIENKDFFLTPKGAHSPISEYQTAIALFNTKDNMKKCDFPARFLYLKRKNLVKGTLKTCKEYQNFLNDVQPKSVTMLFTNAYMNNPSSMFGHTLFRIDTKRKGTQLLAHGANFGADTGDETGVLYVLKGLWGGYFGTFGIHPYYDVINLYNNIENRDIWEYKLNFSFDELELFTAHLWEMQTAKIRYYFASKNCSYVLLLMLEAVKPELNLADNFPLYAIPLDTLKAINQVPDLITKTNYRPSRQSKLKYRASQMNDKQKKVFKNIIKYNKTDFSSLADEEKADVLETAYQYIQYRYVEKELELKDYRQKSFNLLKERSKIINQKQYFDELKTGENPLFSHNAMQLSVNFGSLNGNFFKELSFKPAYTTLLDNSYGLLKGAEIDGFATKFRHYDNKNKYVLHEFDILHIKSLSPNDMMFSPFSYDLNATIKRLFNPKTEKDHTTALIELGAGKTYALTKNTYIYAMSVPNMAYSGAFKHNGYLGFALKGGIYYNRNKFRLNTEAKQNFTTTSLSRGQTYSIETAYDLGKNILLFTSYSLFNTKYHNNEEITLGLKFNF